MPEILQTLYLYYILIIAGIVIGSIIVVICALLIIGWCIRRRRRLYKGETRIDGKTVVITGGNTGIGKETARYLAKRGGRVIILCRNLEKGNVAADEIRKETNSYLEVYEMDLTDLKSIRNCAEKLKKDEPTIDILINNAGVMMTPKLETEDGFEMQIGTNYFGHFLLTLLLLDNIKAASLSRIINVSSHDHKKGKMRWHDIHWRKKYSSIDAYRQSKLANVLFTKSLAEKLEGTGVNTYALHPGVVSTELTRHIKCKCGSCLNFITYGIRRFVSKDPVQGAQTSIYCAVHEKLKTETGKYYSGCKEEEAAMGARSKEDAERLWELSLETVGLDQFSV